VPRSTSRTSVRNLVLAGDRLATDTAACMEGATRAGRLAAEELAAQACGRHVRLARPVRPLDGPVRWVARAD
jgi:uncharacterized protein with NAD-binding domain and iron-sulfur cluster